MCEQACIGHQVAALGHNKPEMSGPPHSELDCHLEMLGHNSQANLLAYFAALKHDFQVLCSMVAHL